MDKAGPFLKTGKSGRVYPSQEKGRAGPSLENGIAARSLENGKAGPPLEKRSSCLSLEKRMALPPPGRSNVAQSLESVMVAFCCSKLATDMPAGEAGVETACWIHLGMGNWRGCIIK